jgi:hypothetical protein
LNNLQKFGIKPHYPIPEAQEGAAADAAPKEDTANEQYVGAAEIYAMPNSAMGIKTFMGQRVKLEVVVKIARDVPLIEIVQPGGDVAKNPISAHIFSIGNVAGEWKQGGRLLIKGIVVDQGYGAYMIYLHEAESVK